VSPWRAAALLFAWLLSMGSTARADLEDDIQHLEKAWSPSGDVQRMKPRLLERGDIRPLLLPRAAVDTTSEECTTVVVLGSVSMSFVLRFLPARGALYWPEGEHPEQSIAGAAQLVRCGVRRSMLERLAVEMRSPRGVIEVLVARGSRPFPPLLRTLASREPGPIAPVGISGPRPVSPPLTDRLRAVEARAGRDGALAVDRRWYHAAQNGAGEIEVRLSEGCHRLDLLGAPAEDPTTAVDIDTDLVAVGSGDVVAADHTESSDASVELCVGTASAFRLRFVGALPGLPVVLASTRFALPPGLPPSFSPQQSAKMAEALRQYHGPALTGSPVYTSLGVSGVTLLPIELEPGSCYLAAVTAVRGEASGVALSVEVGPFQSENRSPPGKDGATLAFCARGANHALVDVEARGAGVSWLLGLWSAGRIPLGEVAE
jgi:hypothetical protein